jgi:excisionase family DNA binding protein
VTIPRCLPVTEVAELLAVSVDAVYDLIRRGDLKAVNVGRRKVIAEPELAAFIERGGVAA